MKKIYVNLSTETGFYKKIYIIDKFNTIFLIDEPTMGGMTLYNVD